MLNHPSYALAALGLVSGTLGSLAPDFGLGAAPHLGIYLVLAGIWFALVVGFGVSQWGGGSWTAVATAVLATWIAWELAINLAMQLEENWLEAAVVPAILKTYLSGIAAGAVGALVTWAGAAASVATLRRPASGCLVVATGALFGLLLPWTNNFDNPAILLVPWQAAVAAALGFGLSPAPYPAARPAPSSL